MATLYSPKIVTNGLVLALDAANPKSYVSGSTTWFDLSGNNNHATIQNGVGYSTANGGSLTFDGVDDYAIMSSSVSLITTTPSFIIGCTPGNGTVFAKGRYADHWNYGLTSVTQTTFRARNNNADVVSPSVSAVTGMNIFSCVWTGTTINFYRNGVFLGNNSASYSPQPSNNLFLTIGMAQTSLGNPTELYNGQIAFILVYNRTLNAQEVQQNFNATRTRFGI